MMAWRIGVVGCGSVLRQYAPVLLAAPELSVVAAADPDPVGRATARSLLGDVEVYEDAAAMLISQQPDVSVLLTPPALHEEHVLQALAAGTHVYCEKPLTATLDRAHALVEIAVTAGRHLAWAPDTTLSALASTAAGLVNDGVIGDLVHIDTRYVCAGHEVWHPRPADFYAPSGGPLRDLGPYCFATLAFYGGRPLAVSATALPDPSGRIRHDLTGERLDVQVATHVTGTVTFASGTTGAFTVSFQAPGADRNETVLYGTTGVLRLPSPEAHGGIVERWDHALGVWQPMFTIGAQQLPERGIGVSALCRRIADGKPPPPWSLDTLDLLAAADRSIATGHRVTIGLSCESPV
jgi:predicted dehydrogenase